MVGIRGFARPSRATGPFSRVSRVMAAPSPILIPSLPVAKGVEIPAERDSRLAKPFKVRRQRLSTPATACHHTRLVASELAEIKARALDEQAVEMA